MTGTRVRPALRDDDGQGADREEGRLLARELLTMAPQDDGAWRLHGLLGAESGAKPHAALDALSAPAPALEGIRDQRSARQRRAQALVHLADTWLTSHDTAGPDASLPGSARAHVSVTVPISGILRAREASETPGCLDGGYPLSPATLAAMTCDAIITPILTDHAGSALDVGQRQDAFPQRTRAAITVRDQHCTYPRCPRPPPWCQVHHLTTYADGGPTSERNATLLCGHHHRLVHARRWRGHLENTRVIWHPPHRQDPHPGSPS